MEKTNNDKRVISGFELDQLRTQIKAKHVYVSFGALGSTDCAVIKISLDARETWANGIYENSRSSTFFWDATGAKLEQLTCWKVAKMRKSRALNTGTVIAKINEIVAATT